MSTEIPTITHFLRYEFRYTSTMKTAVSIPYRAFQSAEKLATRLGVSRSELYARALASLVERHREDLITEKLNEIYSSKGEQLSLDPAVVALQARCLASEKW